MKIPKFKTKKELFKFLIENKDILIAQKKAEVKHADGFLFVHSIDKAGKVDVVKVNEPVDVSSLTELKVTAIINTTNLMDSHLDVHLPGLWKKSLQENKMIMHLQEHKMAFDKIIAEGNELKVFVKFFKWSELGFDYEGSTQALVFESTIKKSRNEFMFNQYANGFVKNHSVGMRYVKLLLAINDPDEVAEFEAWEKYINEVANKETAIARGYFWPVKEAKAIEGSAVPLGSNFATPTLENNRKEEKELTSLDKEIENFKTLIDLMDEPPQEPEIPTLISSTQKEIDWLTTINEEL